MLLCVPLLALVTPTSPTWISGDGAAHALATSGAARWVQFVCPSTNSSHVFIGASNVSSSNGVDCAPGGAFFMPPLPSSASDGITPPLYDLTAWFYLVANGDKLSITRANP